ncbi:MAG: thermonuclease family protein [Marinosulfonomonas sp.]|nr:thermonuclease family protein [Marinosulfonomonas sp.]
MAGCAPTPEPQTKPKNFAQSGCTIDRVIDGDTVHVSCTNGANGNLRLMGFDTPETYQSGCRAEHALGTKAKIRLQHEIAKANSISTKTFGPDKYRRLLAQLYLDGRDVADIMIAAGLAVRYSGGKRINWCQKLAGQI